MGSYTRLSTYPSSEMPPPPEPGTMRTVLLERGPTGFGFNLKGTIQFGGPMQAVNGKLYPPLQYVSAVDPGAALFLSLSFSFFPFFFFSTLSLNFFSFLSYFIYLFFYVLSFIHSFPHNFLWILFPRLIRFLLFSMFFSNVHYFPSSLYFCSP